MTDIQFEMVKDIYKEVGKIQNMNERLKKIEKCMDTPGFRNGLAFLETYSGEEKSLMYQLEKSYGIKKVFSGHELLDKLFEKLARELERKNAFFHSLIDATAFKIIELLAIIGMFIFFYLRN